MSSDSVLAGWVWVCFGAGVGRLVARDTVFIGTRNRVLRRWVVVPASVKDVAAECRKGIKPYEASEGQAIARSKWGWKKAAGLSCPSCSAFWCLLAARLILEPRTLLTRKGVIELFAVWGGASAITRAVP